MTNLKKTLAVVLAFAMILSMGFSAFAYTDVAEGTKVAEAVGILSNLNILTGFEDGTFKPDETVTRAQMAAIICRTLGYEDQAKSSAGSTIFNDVAADHWAAGYINVAQSLQIINGYGDGNYGPEDQVTYEQAVKMIVVALGYELDAQAKGGWSTGYLAVASREGITKNANGVVGSAASRGTVAVLVYNSLEVRLMDQKSWTTGGAEDSYGKTDNTILSQYLDVQRVEGVVLSVPFADYAVSGYEEDADAMISFETGAKAFYYSNGVLEDSTALVESAYDVSLVPEANEMSGKKVVAYVGKEADDMTGNFMVYAIAEKQSANTVTVISAAQLATDSTKADDKGVIAYTAVGSSRVETLDLDDSVRASLNYKYESSVDEETTTNELKSTAGNGIITLISNDGDKQVDVVQIVSYTDEAVVETVTNDEGVLTFELHKGNLDDIDTEDEDMLYVVIKDGAVATPAAIAANDTVSVVNAHKTFQVLYVSSKTVTGTVDSYDDEVVTIGGVDYELSAMSDYDNTSKLSGKEGIFFLNVDGQISHDEAEASKGNYAIVVAAAETTGLNGGYELEVVLADGTSAAYVLADKAYVADVDANVVSAGKTDKDVFDYVTAKLTDTGSAYEVMYEDIEDVVYEVSVKNGKISKLVELDVDGTANGKEYDAENMSYGAITFDEATVIVSVEGKSGEAVEADDITIGTVADFMVDGEGEKYNLAALDVDNDVAGLVIGKGLDTAVPQDGAAVIITAVKTKEIDNDTAYVITGLQAGEEVSYTIYDEEDPIDADDFAKGNIVLLGVANTEGIVSNYELLYTEKDGALASIDCDEDEYYYAGDLDESQAPTSSKFYLENVDEKYDAASNKYVAADGVVMRNAARYTLVDFSESKTPEVSKKSKGTGLFSRYTNDYDYKVFVRYFEDSQVEVVVYKYAQQPEA